MTRVEALKYLTQRPEWTATELAAHSGFKFIDVSTTLLRVWKKHDATRRWMPPAPGQRPCWHYSITPRGARSLKLLTQPPIEQESLEQLNADMAADPRIAPRTQSRTKPVAAPPSLIPPPWDPSVPPPPPFQLDPI